MSDLPEKRGRGRPKGVRNKPKEPKQFVFEADEAADLRRLMLEKLRRQIDGLNLYRPMPLQEEFHTCNAHEKLIRGSNRSGKTTAAAVEVARAVMGLDQRHAASDGIAYIVGKDGKEVANVMYKLLFRAGAIKMIRDLDTNQWRSYNPSDPKDLERKKEARHAPPLIPQRMVKSIAWENKKANLPSIITLHNGWELHFFSSNALPPHGTQINLAWFDEEILHQNWYSEVAARLVDREGYFIWSATPQAGTVQLYELHERAEKEARLPKEERQIEEFVSLLADNVHLTAKQKYDFESKLNPDEVMVRIHGEFASHGLRVFPEFSVAKHVCSYFEIPSGWTRYVAIDPGRQICAALFCAVPDDGRDHMYAYDELYIPQCNAELFGRRMRDKCHGHNIEAFIIDHQEGRKAETGSGRTVEDQYAEALKNNRVVCNRTGSEFTWGVADPEGGVEAVRAWLKDWQDGVPRLQVFEQCANFIFEMKRYWYETKTVGGIKVATDTPRARGSVHLCACIRYIVQDDPVYVAPRSPSNTRGNRVWQWAQKIMNPNKDHGNTLNLGPGSLTIGIGGSSYGSEH